jgi:LmbE family N-acetylglucosaminyl deacetylase
MTPISAIMERNRQDRRDFIKQTAIGLAGVSILPGTHRPNPGGERQTTAADRQDAAAQTTLRILCVGAHPGDPEFGCGGTMARYADAGHSVTLLYLTRGEAYDSSKTYSESAAIRTKEAETACRLLNTKPLFAGQIDGNTVLDKTQNGALAKMIADQNPDLVFTHWPLDTHPDHQVAGQLTLNAWVRSGKRFKLYFYEVNTGSETMAFTPTDYVDITSVRDKKNAAMFAHKSQGPEDVYNGWFKTMEGFRGLEAGVPAAEAFFHLDNRPFLPGLPG